MWASIQSFVDLLDIPLRYFLGLPPLPPSVSITGVRIPPKGSPHLVTLNTTSAGVSEGPDCFLFHVPDLRAYWGIPRAWQWRDVSRRGIKSAQFPNCDGVYMFFFSFALDDLPRNTNFPSWLLDSSGYGDVFVVKLQPHEFGEYGWAAYDNISREFLELLRHPDFQYRRDWY
ncbi:hypothetical protein BDW59DRAFT_151921 [Aspergillus cavernicola]|uniref:Uncharacterized protein n=1 Tax=Aspergillus cavernicola TaxID=176166 RepID=A0ABR4HTC0_9EURO